MKKNLFSVLGIGLVLNAFSQDLMMQGWYWTYPKTCDGGSWAVELKNKAQQLKDAGFTYVWLPPLSRASFGNCSVGYDPKDLYDLGENYGGGPTGFGTRAELDALIHQMDSLGIYAVVDVIYNHRDGGKPENNPAVKDYITIHHNEFKAPFPSDRYHCVLPLTGSLQAGTYYLKLASKSGAPGYYNAQFKVYTRTNRKQGFLGTLTEDENNGGLFNGGVDCGQGNNTLPLNYDFIVTLDDGASTGGCFTDELQITLDTSDFYASGDSLFIYLRNVSGGYSDHRMYEIWYDGTNSNVEPQLQYHTYTDFTQLPSGQGLMNYENFKPNSSNVSTTNLSGDWDGMWFFYDYDQYNPDTKSKLFEFTEWLWNNAGIRGFRMDAVKHFNPDFVGDLMDYLHDQNIMPGMVVGEVYDANPTVLKNWVDQVYNTMDMDTKNDIQVRVFDFTLREALKNACDAFGYDVRNVFQNSLVDAVGSSPFQVVTFVNNHDFRDKDQPVQNDALLAYAYILTNNKVGLPCVFYPEYFGDSIPNAPQQYLKPAIDQLWDAHKQYITGANQTYYLNAFSSSYSSNYLSGYPNTSLLYQLSGQSSGKDVVVAINFAGETLKVDQQIQLGSIFVGDTLTDILGNSAFPYAVVNGSGQIYMELPPRSYSVWVKGNNPVLVQTAEQNILSQQVTLKTLAPHVYVLQTEKQTQQPVQLVNQMGQVIQQYYTHERIDLNALNPGLYFLHVQGQVTFKVVKW